jgi:ABC-type microcin C transport system duplicated ATPase subunit YejF
LAAGEVLAVVGESGSADPVTALALTRLLPSARVACSAAPSAFPAKVLTLPEHRLAKVRGGSIAYIFQEPGSR